jgi:GT2 family glycosyltransferase
MLDEDYGSYLEDVDFGLRCALAGLAGVYVPEALGYHQGSATLGRWHSESVRQIARNQILLIAKNYPGNWIARYGWPVLIAQALWGLVALRHGAGLAYVRGKLEGLRCFGLMRPAGALSESAQNALKDVLENSEREIHGLQTATGFDLYWRVYFALT